MLYAIFACAWALMTITWVMFTGNSPRDYAGVIIVTAVLWPLTLTAVIAERLARIRWPL